MLSATGLLSLMRAAGYDGMDWRSVMIHQEVHVFLSTNVYKGEGLSFSAIYRLRYHILVSYTVVAHLVRSVNFTC